MAEDGGARRPEKPIRLFVLPPGWGVPFSSAAPFSLKLETWLRIAGLNHEVIVEPNTAKGPKQKSPWIEDGDVRMGDSELIIGHLSERYGVDPDSHLGPMDRALSVAWRRTFEEHYHQALEHQLFFGRGGPERLAEFASLLPPIPRVIVPILLSRGLMKQLKARGLARHTEAEIIDMGKADLDAASTFLGDKEYFLGKEPCGLDASVFGFLGVSVYVRGDNPLFKHAASLTNLVAYCERMRGRFFPETVGSAAKS